MAEYRRNQLGAMFEPPPSYNEIIGVRVNVTFTILAGTPNAATIERSVTINARAQSNIAGVVAAAVQAAVSGQISERTGAAYKADVTSAQIYSLIEGGLEGPLLFY